MAEPRGRRPRRRRKACVEEVLPSTDLPPLVQGDLRCFLVIDIGKIVWSSTATAQVPPASPAYIRLRWWGESSEGTVFKPSYVRNNEKTVKCRCRFGVRSGAKQMSAYFVDMGSIVFELLTSPKSVPLGRIQVPKVAHLTSSNPIRDYFPIISPSSRKIGELEIHIRFKSLEAAYDLTTDTGTDTSISSRSRPPSEIGRRSRSRGSSIGSKASARSRSSSTGSRINGRRKRSGSKKSRRRSVSTESNASSASKRSHSIKKGSTISSSTPRGIDDVLETNGQDLFSMEQKLPKKSNLKSSEKKEMDSKETPPTVQQDAISILLQKGTRLKEDIIKSQLDESKRVPIEKSQIPPTDSVAKPVESAGVSQIMPSNPSVRESVTSKPQFLDCPKMVGPIREKTQDMDMRFVDLVFGSQEFTGGGLPFWSEMDSHVGSPLSSIVSELDDNPLYDESLLQQMFYNNKGLFSFYGRANQNRDRISASDRTSTDSFETMVENTENPLHGDRLVRYLTKHITGVTKERIANLHRVYCVAVTIETLTIYDILINKTRAKKGRGRGGKPPVPSPKKGKSGTYFVEFQFPEVSRVEKRDHPSTMKTIHDVTRVVSRKMQPSSATIAIFDESYEFPYKFTDENLLKWTNENMEFTVHQRKASDKKASLLGSVKLPLRDLLSSVEDDCKLDLDVQDGSKTVGSLKAVFKFHIRPERSVCDEDKTQALCEKEEKMQDMKNGPINASVPIEDGHRPSIAIGPPATVLNMMVLVTEGMNIPGTTVTNPQSGTKVYPPNVSLVCRTLSPGECDKTPVIWGQNNPKFDFVQVIPVKIDDSMLVKMKNNYVIIEVWAKITVTTPPSEKLLGLTKLPTHHFFQSLKDEEISKVVLNSMHPIISVDEPVPVMDLFSGQERGHLQVTLALGTQAQIANLRKVKSDIQGRNLHRNHHLEQRKDDPPENVSGFVQHTFEMNIVKLHNFRPPNNELWGEAECFVQYLFPTQQKSEKDDSLDMNCNSLHPELALMESYRSETTLCIPDPAFNHARHHKFAPPPSVPIQRILLSCCYSQRMPGGIPFELWSRYYHPNVRDRLLAKGTLPMAKVGSLVTMSHSKLSEQSFHVPMFFVESDSAQRSAGSLEVAMKYKASGTTTEMLEPPMKFSKPVILRVSLLKACGLKEAVSLACHRGNDDILKQCVDVGVNTYVEMKPSFLPDEDVRRSRIVACSFSPEYQHHMEIACPLISYHRDVTPISLAELLLSGEIEIKIWHRSEDADTDGRSDVCLAKLNLPTRNLLHKFTGAHGWHSLHPPEHSREEKTTVIAGLEMSVSFANYNDLDMILKAAKATKWELPPFESRLLSDDIKNYDITGSDCVTFSVTVTNAWLPKDDLLIHGRTSVDKSANVYVRYKFFDHDSVVSTPSPLPSKQPLSIDARFENLTSARIAHKKSFVCKRSRPLHWYLREEKMEIQVWLTHSAASKQSRPCDADKLLGSCFVEFSSISEWQKEQHISGSFPMFKAGVDSLGGQLRVYVSMKPGEVPDPIPDPKPESVTTNEGDDLQKSPILEEISPRPSTNDHTFDATVTIERAFHLPRVNDLETDEPVYPNVFVSYDVVDVTCLSKISEDLKIVTMATRIVTSSENVTWNEAKTVSLLKSLLTGSDGAMIIKVWHRDRLYMDSTDSKHSNQTSISATDRMLGFAAVDLSVLRAGFRDVNGWYNILDIHGQCQGQLKVAVTPTRSYDSSQPSSARSNDPSTMFPCPAPPLVSIPPNFLHKVPIDVPVQTPSGSMYVPGVQSSVNIVESKSSVSTCPEHYAGLFHADFCQADNIPVAPTASMFRYVTSDRQQANLVNTLEKQISELESITKRFEERKRARFQETVGHNVESSQTNGKPLAPPSTCKIPESMHEGNDAKPSSTGDNGPGIAIISVDVPRPEVLPKDYNDSPRSSSRSKQSEHRTESDSSQKNSIHLSLYQPRKNADLDDRLLSDNDVDLDIEFVQPQSLNESLNVDDNQKSPDSSDRIIKKPPHVTPSHSDANFDKPTLTSHKHFASPELGNVVTPSRSEGHSALDDTSLWLTGSTLHERSLISDDENDGKIDDVHSESEKIQGDDQGRESVQSDTPRSVVTPLDEDIQSNDALQTATSEDLENPAIHEVDSPEKDDTDDRTADNIDNPHAEHEIVHSLGSSSNSISTKDHVCNVEESSSPTAEGTIESRTSESAPDEERSECSDIPDQVDQVVNSPEIVAAAFSDCEQNGLAEEDSISEDSSVKSQNEENHCPNRTIPSSRRKQQEVCSSFYPPSKNIQTSIREIQEATRAHKDELVKIRRSSVDSEEDQHRKTRKNSDGILKSKAKKMIPNTVHYSDERTQRLARIFRTKFSQ